MEENNNKKLKWTTNDQETWSVYMKLLRVFKQRFGHCLVPIDYRVSSGEYLGRWMRLVDFGCWNVPQHCKDELNFFRARVGIEKEQAEIAQCDCEASLKKENVHPPHDINTDELNLFRSSSSSVGVGVEIEQTTEMAPQCSSESSLMMNPSHNISTESSEQDDGEVEDEEGHQKYLPKRTYKKKEQKTTSTERRWERNIDLLKKYKIEYGDCLVPYSYKTKEGIPLGNWVNSVRSRGLHLKPERRELLNDIGFVWHAAKYISKIYWNRNVKCLIDYREEYGDCLVPKTYKTPDGIPLGFWVHSLRNRQLEPKYREQLDAIGFVWQGKHKDLVWKIKFDVLALYKQKFGDCSVPSRFVTDSGMKLGQWVQDIRFGNISLTPSRKKQLNAIGFVWKKTLSWAQHVALMAEYKRIHGSCQVPSRYVTPSGDKLGQWVSYVRARYNSSHISRARIAQLEAIGFIWTTKKEPDDNPSKEDVNPSEESSHVKRE